LNGTFSFSIPCVFAVLCPLPLSAIAQLGDELQPKHHLLVLSLPGGDITRRLHLAITAGPIWNVQFDEAHGLLIAASLIGEGVLAATR
jgi:hypothetical protein